MGLQPIHHISNLLLEELFVFQTICFTLERYWHITLNFRAIVKSTPRLRVNCRLLWTRSYASGPDRGPACGPVRGSAPVQPNTPPASRPKALCGPARGRACGLKPPRSRHTTQPNNGTSSSAIDVHESCRFKCVYYYAYQGRQTTVEAVVIDEPQGSRNYHFKSSLMTG